MDANSISVGTFYEIFCQRVVPPEMDECEKNSRDHDVTVCSICNAIRPNCSALPGCWHPACEKCLELGVKSLSTSCKMCASIVQSDTAIQTPHGRQFQTSDEELNCKVKANASQDAYNAAVPWTSQVVKMDAASEERQRAELSGQVKSIQTTLWTVTKDKQCHECLSVSKWQLAEMSCLDCGISLCRKCDHKHRAVPGHADHIVTHLETRKSKSNEPADSCLKHGDQRLIYYCTNCDSTICLSCHKEQHAFCERVDLIKDKAEEERVELKQIRPKYAQVMKFFTEQRRDLEETLAALESKKRGFQSRVRAFFSALIKACMDVEKKLLEELETSVSDHTDILQEHSKAWLELQENMQLILDQSELLLNLPSLDLVPLATASRGVLRKMLKYGEMLAATAPPEMTLSLSLDNSSQKSIIKRISEIGSSVLTVTTSGILSLRQTVSADFRASDDFAEPLVTGLVLLTQTLLLAVDFNNCCIKLMSNEDGTEEWQVTEILALKCKPYGVTLLNEKWTSSSSQVFSMANDQSQSRLADTACLLDSNSSTKSSGSLLLESTDELTASQQKSVRQKSPLKRQSVIMLEDPHPMLLPGSELTPEILVAVSSPSGQCFVVAVNIKENGNASMNIINQISLDKGCWGLTALDNRTLAISCIDGNSPFITVVDVMDSSVHCLASSNPAASILASPRHLLAISPSTFLVADHGKKAVTGVNTDGTNINSIFTFTGHGNERLSRPEGMCKDWRDRVFIVDSRENCVMVLANTGNFLCKTSSGHSGLFCPQAVCVDRNCRIYVSNDSGKSLSIFDMLSFGE